MLLGHQLRRLREAARVTADQAAEEIRATRAKISRMENGRVGFKARDVADLLTLYGVTSEQTDTAMLDLARRASTPGWWAAYSDILPGWFEAYLGLEAAASLIRTFELQFVHGLFQTEDYAQAVIILGHQAAPAWEIDTRVALRMKRQDLLTSADPPQVRSVIDETTLRRPVGAQLHHLLETPPCPRSPARPQMTGPRVEDHN
jgi:transcriptional regulator with XRE-family HTH domain